MTGRPEVTELRLVVTAPDYEQALRFYRDVLGLPERAAYTSPGGRVTILEAGRATLELADPPHAAYIDDVEVGHRAAGRGIRRALGQAQHVTVEPQRLLVVRCGHHQPQLRHLRPAGHRAPLR